MLGRAFVHGLQGDDPTYLKAAACAKHFAVHSGPEPSRHSDNFNPSSYDLWDTYLPAFKELMVNAKVAGVMCAYNAVDTQPCCANDQLMNDILRNQWKFTGYVTSDCWAVDDFFRYHKTHKDAITSAVDAVMHGTDVECGNTVYKTLLDAVRNGLISEAQIDVSLRRLFTIWIPGSGRRSGQEVVLVPDRLLDGPPLSGRQRVQADLDAGSTSKPLTPSFAIEEGTGVLR